MRLSISKRNVYAADCYALDTRAAKRLLRERQVSILALDYHLRGQENGRAMLLWAARKNVLPSYVVITESARDKRLLLAAELLRLGFRSADGANFIKS